MIKQIVTSIWFLALIIAIPVIVFLPDIFSKYQTDLLFKQPTDSNIIHIYFEDLNGDGTIEKITCHKNSVNELAFQLHSEDGAIKSQHNFNYNYFYRINNIYFGDIDDNGQQEIYGFTLKKDSLFLNWFEPTISNEKQKSRFIAEVNTFDNGKIDISILHFEVVDLDNDTKNEILISIEAGYSIHPRVLIVYKPDEDKFIRSADWGINSYTPFLHDLNNDGVFEIVASSSASDNLLSATGVPNVDDRPWLQVYDAELNHFFEPVSFSKGLSNTTETFVTNDGKNELIVFNCNRSRDVEEIICLYKFDKNGNVKDSIYLSDYGKNFNFKVFQTNSEFIFFAGNEVLWINNNLKITQIKEIPQSNSIVAIDTLSKLKQPYYIALSQKRNKLNIFTEDFDEMVTLDFENEIIKSVKTNTNKGADCFFVRTDDNEYYYRFEKDVSYLLKYPTYFLIYLLAVSFIWFIQIIREKQLREKFELQNQVRELQLKTFRNQLNPHFIFNTFNGVASVLKKGDSETAYNVFMRFSKMVRHILDNFDNDFLTLKQELELVENYIELQKFRFKELFDYKIQLSENKINNFIVPRMIIQIRVENAIKHGLIPKGGGGLLKIGMKLKFGNLEIVIEDNGIGRAMASGNRTSSNGIGIKTIEGLVEYINLGKKKKVLQQTIDLVDEKGNPAGTKVVVIIPSDLDPGL